MYQKYLHKLLWTLPVIVAVAVGHQQEVNNQVNCPSQKEQELNDELRILLIGKTGVGKSATGNTILGKKAFKSDFSSSSVTSECERVSGNVNERKVTVIDSPGLFDTNLTQKEVVNRIKLCVPLSSPGPHVFVVVIRLGRYTEEDEKTVEIFQGVFGKGSSSHTMVLFTHGDLLKGKNFHQFVRSNSKLLNFVKECGGGYHLFNNEDQNPEQVLQLLDQIDKIVTQNDGKYYTTYMLRQAERVLEAETERIMKENEAKRQKEIKELRKQFKGEDFEREKQKKNKQHQEEAREEAQTSPGYLEYIAKMLITLVNTVYNYL